VCLHLAGNEAVLQEDPDLQKFFFGVQSQTCKRETPLHEESHLEAAKQFKLSDRRTLVQDDCGVQVVKK
jgi:hypothetical protein